MPSVCAQRATVCLFPEVQRSLLSLSPAIRSGQVVLPLPVPLILLTVSTEVWRLPA